MDDLIAKQLNEEDHTDFHKQMLEDSKALVNISRRKMNTFYATWDKNDEVYRSIRAREKSDLAASERGEPEKMIVPISYAQIQTFVAFCFSLYSQRDNFFELSGFTAEDEKPAKIGEALLQRDLSKNLFEAKLSQYLLDVARFGIGILKTSWVTEQALVKTQVEIPAKTFLGVQIGSARTEEQTSWTTSYEGNRVVNISPYRFFPDVRLPFTRFQEGEFCASEDVYSFSQLKQWEKEGVVAGVDYIKPLSKDIAIDRGYRWDTYNDPGGSIIPGAGVRGEGQTKRTVIITEIQRTIIPSMYKIGEEPLGPEDYPVKYNIWYANDNRVIKCEPLGYIHNEFTYSLGQYTYDNNTLVSSGLSDVIDQLQNVISWFINSRITNVRKVIGDKLIVNPAYVNMNDLKERKPVIRLTGAAAGEIDKYIKQLQLTDVTVTHISDVKNIHDILKTVTGITDSILGEVRPGKRSATENRNTTAGAANRLKTIAAILFTSSLEQMGRQMLSNLRDGLDAKTYVQITGMKGQSTPEFIQVSKQDLVGHYDFEVFDGTLPSERYLTAQALEELVTELLGNPQLAVMLGFDVKKMILEILELRGVRNPERFQLSSQDQQMQQMQQQAQLNGQPNPTNGSGQAPAGGNGTPPSGSPGTLPESLLPILAGSPGGRGTLSNGHGLS